MHGLAARWSPTRLHEDCKSPNCRQVLTPQLQRCQEMPAALPIQSNTLSAYATEVSVAFQLPAAIVYAANPFITPRLLGSPRLTSARTECNSNRLGLGRPPRGPPCVPLHHTCPCAMGWAASCATAPPAVRATPPPVWRPSLTLARTPWAGAEPLAARPPVPCTRAAWRGRQARLANRLGGASGNGWGVNARGDGW